MEVKQILFKLFHLIGVLHYAYAIFYDVYFVFPEEVKFRKYSFGGKFIYLTFWDTVSLWIFFSSPSKVQYEFVLQFFSSFSFLESPTDLFFNRISQRFYRIEWSYDKRSSADKTD